MSSRPEDPRIRATRQRALDVALELMVDHGALEVSYRSVSQKTGISRSTLYRHWPRIEELRSDVLREATKIPSLHYETRGSLAKDLTWILDNVVRALDESVWGKIVAHSVSIAANEETVRALLREFMAERREFIAAVIEEARARGEIGLETSAEEIFDVAIGVPYFRRLVEGMPLDEGWRRAHVRTVCHLAGCRKP